MNVILPQYIAPKNYVPTDDDRSVYAQLLSSSVGTDPVSGVWSGTAEYTTGQTAYYLDQEGPCVGCWCKYEALQDMTTALSTLNKNPYSEKAYWVSLGAIEMYKMFDQYSNTRTTDTNNIIVTLYCRAITDIAFLRVQAQKVIINIWNALPSATYPYTDNCTAENKIVTDQVVDLVQPIYNWFEYWFKELEYIRDITRPIGVTLYNNLIIKIEFVKYDDIDCFVGTLIPGKKHNIGRLQYGVRTGIEDYSKVIFDETFGSLYAKQGNYRKTFEGTLHVSPEDSNLVNSVLTQLRAKPTILQGNKDDTSTTFDDLLMYGIIKFTAEKTGPNLHKYNIEAQGMI